MQNEVVYALYEMEQEQILAPEQAQAFRRVASGRLASIRLEIRLLLYLGVLMLVAGIGLFVKEYYDRIGPVAVAVLLAGLTLVCLLSVWKKAPPFTWEAGNPGLLATDYILLLGMLLAASTLAFVESQFKTLDALWAHHFLILALLYFLAAYRFDSRSVLSLGVTAFAAWLGLSLNLDRVGDIFWRSDMSQGAALGGGLLYLAVAYLGVKFRKKGHFESVWATYGLLILGAGLLIGVYSHFGPNEKWSWFGWSSLTIVVAGGIVYFAYRWHRPLYFALGTLLGYLGLVPLLIYFPSFLSRSSGEPLSCLLVAVSSIAVLVLIFLVGRHLKEDA